jgi:hypothetical protein
MLYCFHGEMKSGSNALPFPQRALHRNMAIDSCSPVSFMPRE